MPYRELIMIDIKEMLRRRAAGQSARLVARETGVDRKTVGRYYAVAAEALSLSRERGARREEEVLAVAGRVQARPLSRIRARSVEASRSRGTAIGWQRGSPRRGPSSCGRSTRCSSAHHGVTASSDTLRRFAIEELGWRKKPTTVRLADTEPGQIAQVDFGLMGTLVDPRRRGGPGASPLGAHRDARLQPLPVRVAVVRADHGGGVRGPRCGVVVLRCDGAGSAAGQHVGDGAALFADELGTDARASVPRLRACRRADCSARCGAGRVRPRTRPTGGEPGGVRARELVRRRDVHEPRRRSSAAFQITGAATSLEPVSTARRARQVPREVYEARGEAGDEVPSIGARRSTCLTWARSEGPSRSPRASRAKSLYSVPTRFVGSTVRVRADRATVKIYAGSELV